ncbi:isoprenoid synthase domain-containing protein [Coprinopsis sp. MPI-PUGE-AT-0042]|nr:isoprenoid synthase domain-containing protein [Coprinopsis sp. MPI-PUGE-AT-0042]
MLALSKLNAIVSRVLSNPEVHTAVLLTVSGELVSYAAEPGRSKDEIRVITGLASEVWQETKEQGYGMVDSEMGEEVMVEEQRQPLMLLALNAVESVNWDDCKKEGFRSDQLAKPLKRFRPFLKVTSAPPPAAACRQRLAMMIAMQGIGRSLRASTSTLSRAVPKCPLTRHKRRKLSALAQKTAATTSAPPDPAWSQKVEGLSYGIKPTWAAGFSSSGLAEIAKFYFLHPSKQLRFVTGLALCPGDQRTRTGLATAALGGRHGGTRRTRGGTRQTTALVRDAERLHSSYEDLPAQAQTSPPQLLPTQMRLAQIVEMIHVASLLHDNITGGSQPCDSETASNYPFGNKLSILGGDFLLGRASTVLSHLGGGEVVELISSVISNLVEGEFLRMEDVRTPALGLMEGPKTAEEGWKLYMSKTYFKTASLMAKVQSFGEGELWKEIAYAYGRNLGIAHQLVEDAMEYDGVRLVSSLDWRPGLLYTR